MIDISTLTLILLAHWIGDYLMQFNVIANHKAESFAWLSVHVFIYSIVILLAALIVMKAHDAFMYAFLNGFIHLITDYFTSKISVRFKSNPRVFFLVIGFDQFLHTATLIVTLGVL
jgi:hypothetical protein